MMILRPWFKLILCLVALWGFIRFMPMVFEMSRVYSALVDNSEKMGIDNSALFYSEEEHSLIAEKQIKERLKLLND